MVVCVLHQAERNKDVISAQTKDIKDTYILTKKE